MTPLGIMSERMGPSIREREREREGETDRQTDRPSERAREHCVAALYEKVM